MVEQKSSTNEDPGVTNQCIMKTREPKERRLLYRVDEVPPPGILVSVALQNVLLALGPALAVSYVTSDIICAPNDHPVRAKLFCTTLFMMGLCTLLMPLVGVRLPVYQGASLTFLVPLSAMKMDKRWQCDVIFANATDGLQENISVPIPGLSSDAEEEMYHKLREIMGALLLASLFEVIVGATGLVGILTRFIGPLSISTVITLIGVSLYKIPINYSRTHWGLASLCILLSVLFILYIDTVRVPSPTACCNQKRKQDHSGVQIFKMFPILLALLITWLVCYIMTISGGLSDDPSTLEYRARTDVRSSVIASSPWFYFPYPGQFGAPLFNVAIFVGFLSAVISSVFETIGDYYAVARETMSPPPPKTAINRGILLEGIGSVISGALGAAHATTSYTSHVALLSLTDVASRSGMVCAGILSIIFGVIGKFGGLMTSLPEPAIGGAMFVILGIICSVGIFSLRSVDMTSSRNMTIFGLSLYAGIVIPEWTERYPESINTGNEILNGVITGIIATPMFFGGVVCILLDNTVRGTPGERGLHSRHVTTSGEAFEATQSEVYDLPYVDRLIQKCPCLGRLPFLQDPVFADRFVVNTEPSGV